MITEDRVRAHLFETSHCCCHFFEGDDGCHCRIWSQSAELADLLVYHDENASCCQSTECRDIENWLVEVLSK